MTTPYIPRRGDIVWLNFDPRPGHEQAGRRPAFVISPDGYNSRSGLFIVCPITSQAKGYPFEVAVPAGLPVAGVVLSDQINNLDWKARLPEFACRMPEKFLREVGARILPLIEG